MDEQIERAIDVVLGLVPIDEMETPILRGTARTVRKVKIRKPSPKRVKLRRRVADQSDMSAVKKTRRTRKDSKETSVDTPVSDWPEDSGLDKFADIPVSDFVMRAK